MIFRYVPHHRVIDFARLGWHIADTLQGCSHGEWSILMVWMCGCPFVEPLKEEPKPQRQADQACKRHG